MYVYIYIYMYINAVILYAHDLICYIYIKVYTVRNESSREELKQTVHRPEDEVDVYSDPSFHEKELIRSEIQNFPSLDENIASELGMVCVVIITLITLNDPIIYTYQHSPSLPIYMSLNHLHKSL